MQKIFSLLLIFTCLNSIGQDQDFIDYEPDYYDPNLLGDWELSSYISMNYNGSVKDTILINQDSIYWNVILRIDSDSLQELLIPTGRKEDLQGFDRKCGWRLFEDETRLWLIVPCARNLPGNPEIVFVNEEELHFLGELAESPITFVFRRINYGKL